MKRWSARAAAVVVSAWTAALAPAAAASPPPAAVVAASGVPSASAAPSAAPSQRPSASRPPSAPPASAAPAAAPSSTAADATSGSATGAETPGLPPILDPNAPFVVMADVFVLVPQDGVVHVQELVTGANRSSAPVHGLAFALPPGAVGAAPASGIPPGALRADSAGVHLSMDVPPGGEVQSAFTFTAPWTGGRVWIPVSYPTAQLTVMVPQGRWKVVGAGFSPTGALKLAGKVAVDTYTTVTPTAGALLPVRLRPAAWWNGMAARVALAAAAALCGGAALIGAARRRRLSRALRESELIDALAQLDLAHGRGEVQDDPYGARRQGLLDELAALHGG